MVLNKEQKIVTSVISIVGQTIIIEYDGTLGIDFIIFKSGIT
jgi:hypothetical protein